MEITNLILFILASVGLTSIIVDSDIMRPVRELLQKTLPASVYKLFECYQCTGFWSGIINGFILLSVNPLILLTCGFAGSLVSAGWVYLSNYLEANSLVNLNE